MHTLNDITSNLSMNAIKDTLHVQLSCSYRRCSDRVASGGVKVPLVINEAHLKDKLINNIIILGSALVLLMISIFIAILIAIYEIQLFPALIPFCYCPP